MATRRLRYGTLERDEIDALLARHNVGRIAYTFRDRVDVEPINYVYRDGWIYLRTGPGSKLTTLARHPWVAFEVDEVDGPFDWRSVVGRGGELARDDHRRRPCHVGHRRPRHRGR